MPGVEVAVDQVPDGGGRALGQLSPHPVDQRHQAAPLEPSHDAEPLGAEAGGGGVPGPARPEAGLLGRGPGQAAPGDQTLGGQGPAQGLQARTGQQRAVEVEEGHGRGRQPSPAR